MFTKGMTKLDGYLTILSQDRGVVEISIDDAEASTTVVALEISAEQFVRIAMGRLSMGRCTIHVGNLEHIGKRMEHKSFRFPLPEGTDYRAQKDVARALLPEVVPDGWVADKSFGSQGSFPTVDGVDYAVTTIRRWVAPTDVDSTEEQDNAC